MRSSLYLMLCITFLLFCLRSVDLPDAIVLNLVFFQTLFSLSESPTSSGYCAMRCVEGGHSFEVAFSSCSFWELASRSRETALFSRVFRTSFYKQFSFFFPIGSAALFPRPGRPPFSCLFSSVDIHAVTPTVRHSSLFARRYSPGDPPSHKNEVFVQRNYTWSGLSPPFSPQISRYQVSLLILFPRARP